MSLTSKEVENEKQIKKVAQYYSKLFGTRRYPETYERNYWRHLILSKFLKGVQERCNNSCKLVLVDVGCGNGWWTVSLLKNGLKGLIDRCIGIDLTDSILNLYTANVHKNFPDLNLATIKGDARIVLPNLVQRQKAPTIIIAMGNVFSYIPKREVFVLLDGLSHQDMLFAMLFEVSLLSGYVLRELMKKSQDIANISEALLHEKTSKIKPFDVWLYTYSDIKKIVGLFAKNYEVTYMVKRPYLLSTKILEKIAEISNGVGNFLETISKKDFVGSHIVFSVFKKR